MIKSAASAASLGFAGERQEDGPACGQRGTGRSPANPASSRLDHGFLNSSFDNAGTVSQSIQSHNFRMDIEKDQGLGEFSNLAERCLMVRRRSGEEKAAQANVGLTISGRRLVLRLAQAQPEG